MSRHIRIYYTYGASHCFVSDGLLKFFQDFRTSKPKRCNAFVIYIFTHW